VNINAGGITVTEGFGCIIEPITIEVTNQPLLSIPKGTLLGCPTLHCKARTIRQMNINAGGTTLIEGFGYIIEPITIEVTNQPLLSIPKATLLGCPTLHCKARTIGQMNINAGGITVTEGFGCIIEPITIEVTNQPLLSIPKATLLGCPTLHCKARTIGQMNINAGGITVTEGFGCIIEPITIEVTS
jgi:hypothetical protein